MTLIRIHRPGMFTTVQDLGRPGWSASGVPVGGAADTRSLRIGNRLVGNHDGAAALEMTMVGASLSADSPVTIAITGGECSCTRQLEGQAKRKIQMNVATTLAANEVVSIGPITRGVRAYVCVGGELLVPTVMHSASTHAPAGFGGFLGRQLRTGDELLFDPRIPPRASHSRALDSVLTLTHTPIHSIRAISMPITEPALQQFPEWFWHSEHVVSMQSDRAGIRLIPPVRSGIHVGGRMVSEGMAIGSVQLPPSGEPIILGPDHPTTGGYPVIARIASVDLPRLGQLRPGDRVRFTAVSRRDVLEAFRQGVALLDTVLPPA